MSVKDAPGEVNKNPNFDSPNITSAEEEEQKIVDAEKEARKKAETVEIDGVPIEEKDIKYKTSDISKKAKADYFVNVEGAEERKREAAKKAKIEAEEELKAEKRAAKVRRELEAEEKAKQEAEAARITEERKRQERSHKKESRSIARNERREKIHNFFFGGWHKIVTILIIIAAIAGIIIYFSYQQYQDYQRRIEDAAKEEEDRREKDRINGDPSTYVDTLIEEAATMYMDYKYEAGYAEFERLINEQTNKRVKGELYFRRSELIQASSLDDYARLALEDAKKAKEYYPESAEITYWLANMYADNGNDEMAKKYNEEANELEKQNSTDYEEGTQGEG